MKKILSLGLLLIIVTLTGCSEASNYYKSGMRNFRNDNYEEASNNFSMAIEKNSNCADYFIDYGLALIALGEYDEAVSQLDLAYQEKDITMIKENNKRVLRGKGIAYYHMMEYQKAIEQFDLALQINELSELDMDILNYKGNSLMMIGSYEEAAKVYTVILSIEENNETALYDRAFVYRKLGDYEKSLADYEKVIYLNLDCYDYYFGKYYLVLEHGLEAEAAGVLQQAGDIETKTKEDKFNQAKVHYLQGNYDVALSELSEGFADGFLEAYFYIGQIYLEKKDYSTAIYYYKKYIEGGDALTLAVYNQIGSCLIKLGEYNEAIEYIQKGISYYKDDTLRVLKKNEIIAYESLGAFDIALGKLKEYLSHYPDDKDAKREEEFLKSRLISIED